MSKRYEQFHFGVMNAGARIVGCLFLLVGVAFAISAIVTDSDRVLNAVLAFLCIVGGAALLAVKPVERSDIEGLLSRGREPRRDGEYKKRK